MNNPIVMGIVAGVVSFLASAITSHFARGDLNLVPALVGGVAFGFTFGVLMQWTQKKKPQSKTEFDDSK